MRDFIDPGGEILFFAERSPEKSSERTGVSRGTEEHPGVHSDSDPDS